MKEPVKRIGMKPWERLVIWLGVLVLLAAFSYLAVFFHALYRLGRAGHGG